MTLTADKRQARPVHYANKDARTRVYRALYGEPVRVDPRGLPELNETRKLPENYSYEHALSVFSSLAETLVKAENGDMVAVSNGLFPPQRYRELVSRLERLKTILRIKRQLAHE